MINDVLNRLDELVYTFCNPSTGVDAVVNMRCEKTAIYNIHQYSRYMFIATIFGIDRPRTDIEEKIYSLILSLIDVLPQLPGEYQQLLKFYINNLLYLVYCATGRYFEYCTILSNIRHILNNLNNVLGERP